MIVDEKSDILKEHINETPTEYKLYFILGLTRMNGHPRESRREFKKVFEVISSKRLMERPTMVVRYVEDFGSAKGR